MSKERERRTRWSNCARAVISWVEGGSQRDVSSSDRHVSMKKKRSEWRRVQRVDYKLGGVKTQNDRLLE